MLSLLNKHRGALGFTALPQELEAAAQSTRAFLSTETARVVINSAAISGDMLELDVIVQSLSGHKLPTAYPSRRAWLHVRVNAQDGEASFESGQLNPDGSIAGNDNDENGISFEPHYTVIEHADQVQIYESILVDYQDRVTTGLLSGVSYVKDNRLLPRGFEKASASWEIAVHGGALEDSDFIGGGDRVHYRIDLGGTDGAVTVSVQLMFQTIGYRWAENLRAYDAPETNRFVGYYEDSAGNSAVTLASDTVVLE